MADNSAHEPPTLDNPVGTNVNILASVMLVVMTIVVGMRIWGRWRYKTPGRTARVTLGESRVWIQLSDATIVIAWASAIALSAAQFVYVVWGLGLHLKDLTIPQRLNAMKAFWAYQIIYKFCSGMAKIASLFLMLAIATPNMTRFRLFCKAFIIYITLYSLSTTLVTVFQCKLSFESNWNKMKDQSVCFNQPPFWYAHGVINLTASFVMVFLPWWLFSYVTYKRKVIIGSIMSFLALAEGVLGCVRLWGLIKAATTSDGADITYSSYVGLPVSQLEVDFAVIAACIPTVLRLMEEAWSLFLVKVLGRPAIFTTRGSGSNTVTTDNVHLSSLHGMEKGPQPSGPYISFDRSTKPNTGNDSEEEILGSSGKGISKVTQVSVSSVPARGKEEIEDFKKNKW